MTCKFCGASSCYCCIECGENVLEGHRYDCKYAYRDQINDALHEAFAAIVAASLVPTWEAGAEWQGTIREATIYGKGVIKGLSDAGRIIEAIRERGGPVVRR